MTLKNSYQIFAEIKNTNVIKIKCTKDNVVFKGKLRNGKLRQWKEDGRYRQFIREVPNTTKKEFRNG